MNGRYMRMKVDLYVNSSTASNTVPWHSQKCWSAGCNMVANHPIIESSEYILNAEEEKIKKLLEEYTGKHNIDFETYDIALKSVYSPGLINIISFFL